MCCVPGCGVTDIPALKAVRSDRLTRNQRRILEQHHIVGMHEGGTLTLCLNHHAMLSFEQAFWPNQLREKNRSPVAFIFSFIQALIDCLRLLCSDSRVPDFLSRLWGTYTEMRLEQNFLNEADFDLKLVITAQKLIEEVAQCKLIDPEFFKKFADRLAICKILHPDFCELLVEFHIIRSLENHE